MKISVEFDGKTYEAKPMTWDDVERVEDSFSGFLLNLPDHIAEAKTKAGREKIRKELLKTKANQRKMVEDMLRKYLSLDSKELIELGFLGSMVLFAKMYRENTEIDRFLGMPSGQPSQSGFPQTTPASSLPTQ